MGRVVLLQIANDELVCRYWSRSTPTQASLPRRWASWIASSTIFLSVSRLNHRDWHTTTNVPLSRAAKSKRPCASCCPVNWPNTPCPKALKLSPSTLAPSEQPRRSSTFALPCHFVLIDVSFAVIRHLSSFNWFLYPNTRRNVFVVPSSITSNKRRAIVPGIGSPHVSPSRL